MGFAGYLAALVAALALAPVSGAGMTSHVFVAYRTANYFGRISEEASPHNYSRYNAAIANNQPAVLGGADFPDFGYACGGDHDAGEAAHWPAWHQAAVGYLQARPDWHDAEWSDDTAKLVAFLFGASVHYIADEFFEGLNGGHLGYGQVRARVRASTRARRGGDERDAPSRNHARARAGAAETSERLAPSHNHAVRARGLFATRHDDPSWPHVRARGGGRHDEQPRLTWRVPRARQTFPPTAGISASDPRPRASSRRSVR